MSSSKNQGELKFFFIKLIGITFAVIVILNVTYNLILADKLENINKLLSLNDKDKVLLYKFYLKIKNEFQEIEK